MALDDALALEAGRNGSPATLRLFGWRPPAISLGYHQNAEDLQLEKCRAEGIDVVRRPTGGRAILHSDEVTYSVVIPAGDGGFRETVSSAYELISRALVAGLNELGIETAFDRAEESKVNYTRGEFSVPCFSSSVRHEVVWRGRKLVGSAQRRYDNALLQHGSVLLGEDHLRLVDYLSGVEKSQRGRHLEFLKKHTVTVNEIAGRRVPFSQVAEHLVRGFEEVFKVKFVRLGLNPGEQKCVESLLPQYEDVERRL